MILMKNDLKISISYTNLQGITVIAAVVLDLDDEGVIWSGFWNGRTLNVFLHWILNDVLHLIWNFDHDGGSKTHIDTYVLHSYTTSLQRQNSNREDLRELATSKLQIEKAKR